MANPLLLTIIVLLLLDCCVSLAWSAACDSRCSEYHCPQGDTDCYYVKVVREGDVTGNDSCPEGLSPLNSQVLKYSQSSSDLRTPIHEGPGSVVVALSPSLSVDAGSTICWGTRRNATVSASFASIAPPSPSNSNRLKVAVVRSEGPGVPPVLQLVDPEDANRAPPLCEAPSTDGVRTGLASRPEVVAYTCYELLGTCYYAQQTSVPWQAANSGTCLFGGQLAMAKDASEESLLRSFVQSINSTAWFFLQARECSPEYVMLGSSETLADFVEPLGDFSSAPGRFRRTRTPACVRLHREGNLTMDNNCIMNRWLCYKRIPLTVNSTMCAIANCHAFWNFGDDGAARSTALQRCPAALPSVANVAELMSMAALIPIGNASSVLYHTGIRKLPIAQREFYLNLNTTNGTAAAVTMNSLDASTVKKHCTMLRTNSTTALGVFSAHCTGENATALFCQYRNGSLVTFSAAGFLNYFAARQACQVACGGQNCDLPKLFGLPNNQSSSGGGSDPSAGAGAKALEEKKGGGDLSGDLKEFKKAIIGGSGSISSTGTTTFWLDGFEYQNWTDSNGAPLYDAYLPPTALAGTGIFAEKLILTSGAYNAEECLYLNVTGGTNANLSLLVAPCNTSASIICQSGPTCPQPPVYADGYPSGSGWFNLTANALFVDLMSDNCSMSDTIARGLDSSTFYSCKVPMPNSLSNIMPVVFSTCQASPGRLTWSKLANTSECRSSRCDMRSLFSMSDTDNQKYMRLTRLNDSTPLGSWNWFVANGTRIEVSCLPGAAVGVANDSLATQMAVSPDLHCSSDTWVFNSSFFCNATVLTIEPRQQSPSTTPLYRCRRVQCPTSDFANISSVNASMNADLKQLLEVGARVQVSCRNNSDPTRYYPRHLSLHCLLFENHSYEFAVTYSSVGNSSATRTRGNVTFLHQEISSRCANQMLRTCLLNDAALNEWRLRLANSTEGVYYTQYPLVHPNYLPPNASVRVACNGSYVNGRSSDDIGRVFLLACVTDGTSSRLVFNGNVTNVTCGFQTCPRFSLPNQTELVEARTAAGGNWTDWDAYPPGSQLVIRCANAKAAMQTVQCSDTGQIWFPLQAVGNSSTWLRPELINCTGLDPGKEGYYCCIGCFFPKRQRLAAVIVV